MVRKWDYTEVAARTGWVCGICNGSINPAWHWRSFCAVTIDHIIPLSAGGPDVAENVHLAHRACNEFKGRKLYRFSADMRSISPVQITPFGWAMRRVRLVGLEDKRYEGVVGTVRPLAPGDNPRRRIVDACTYGAMLCEDFCIEPMSATDCHVCVACGGCHLHVATWDELSRQDRYFPPYPILGDRDGDLAHGDLNGLVYWMGALKLGCQACKDAVSEKPYATISPYVQARVKLG